MQAASWYWGRGRLTTGFQIQPSFLSFVAVGQIGDIYLLRARQTREQIGMESDLFPKKTQHQKHHPKGLGTILGHGSVSSTASEKHCDSSASKFAI